ncbi:MAG: Asp-tRNA(Asn)/Glu-tRNA(Gln) amidotransferase subunit GatC [Pseudomonadota bacterium]|nr:Asp-tRNA(Asn)/Glu-tRNA(Gln) amidotransferase subunit GatC [Pseudomonadota bacterium]
MSLSEDDVRRVARLSRLAVSADELPRLQQDLSRILDLAAELKAIDTQGVAPMAHPGADAVALRPDVVTESNRRDAYQAVAPQVEDGLYLVPKVIE